MKVDDFIREYAVTPLGVYIQSYGSEDTRERLLAREPKLYREQDIRALISELLPEGSVVVDYADLVHVDHMARAYLQLRNCSELEADALRLIQKALSGGECGK